MKEITKEGESIFDSYLSAIASKPRTFSIELEGRPTLVFRRTQDWTELQAIRQAAISNVKAAQDGNVLNDWKQYIGSDPVNVGRAVHLARRHVGFIIDGRFVAESLGELHFLKMANMDPHGFTALMDAFNDETGVGWTVEDRDYFREAEERNRIEQLGTAATDGSTTNLEQTP